MVAPSMPTPAVLSAALDYATRGWRVLPLPVRHDGHDKDGKAPALNSWQKDATTDTAIISGWFRRWPTANVGILCDPAFGLAVDIDDLEVMEHLPDFPKTLTSWTPSGGCHLIYRHPAVPLGNDVAGVRAIAKAHGWVPAEDAGGKKRGIDVRGKAGQIVVWPSVSPKTGERWRWVNADEPIAEAPGWLIDALQNKPATPAPALPLAASWGHVDPYVAKAVEEVTRTLAGTAKGQRGGKLFWAAARLGELQVSHGEAERALMGACVSNGLVALDGEASVLRELRRGWEQGSANPVERPAMATRPQASSGERWEPPAVQLEPEADGPRDEAGDVIKPSARAGSVKWPKLNQEGNPVSCRENIEAMLRHYGVVARYNLMTHEDEYTLSRWRGAADKRANVGLAQIREWARKHGLASGEALNDQLCIIVAESSYHPVADWIRSRAWDGIDRTTALFSSLSIASDDAARLALMRRLLIAWCITAAHAAMVPAEAQAGIAAQLVLVIQGPQGVQKTRWIQSLAPRDSGWVREGVMLDPSQRDSVQQATNVWLVELGELDATFRKADVAALKAHLTSRTDTYRAAYARKSETLARRTVYAASVNERGVLHDDTGSRRFAVLPVTECDSDHGVDMQQFWAQMAAQPAEARFLAAEDETALIESNRGHEATDPLGDLCATYWEVDDRDAPSWESLKSVLTLIDRDRQWTTGDARALGKLLANRLGARVRMSRGVRQFAVRPR